MVLGPYIKKNMIQIHEHICLGLIVYSSTLFDTCTCISIMFLGPFISKWIPNTVYVTIFISIYGGIQVFIILFDFYRGHHHLCYTQCICTWMLAYLKFVIQDWPEIKDIIYQNKENKCTIDKLHIFSLKFYFMTIFKF